MCGRKSALSLPAAGLSPIWSEGVGFLKRTSLSFTDVDEHRDCGQVDGPAWIGCDGGSRSTQGATKTDPMAVVRYEQIGSCPGIGTRSSARQTEDKRIAVALDNRGLSMLHRLRLRSESDKFLYDRS